MERGPAGSRPSLDRPRAAGGAGGAARGGRSRAEGLGVVLLVSALLLLGLWHGAPEPLLRWSEDRPTEEVVEDLPGAATRATRAVGGACGCWVIVTSRDRQLEDDILVQREGTSVA